MESEYSSIEIDDGKWRSQANCLEKNSLHLFFTEGRGVAIQYVSARILCFRCSVQRQCLDYAVVNAIKDGIWGGLSYRQRLSYKRGERSGKMTRADLFKSAPDMSDSTIEKMASELSMNMEEVRVMVRIEKNKARKDNARRNRNRIYKEEAKNAK